MTRFYGLTLVVFAVLLLLSGGATGFGRTKPIDSIVYGLDTCDGKLCYLGITIGKTTWTEAKNIINTIPGTSLLDSPHGANIASGATGRIITYADTNDTIFELDLLFRSSTVPVGNVLRQWGVPCAVYSMQNYGTQALVLRYPTVIVGTAVANDWYIQPLSDVGSIEIYRGNPSNIFPCDGSFERAKRYQWEGFTRYPYP